jgi:hypothetical protein
MVVYGQVMSLDCLLIHLALPPKSGCWLTVRRQSGARLSQKEHKAAQPAVKSRFIPICPSNTSQERYNSSYTKQKSLLQNCPQLADMRRGMTSQAAEKVRVSGEIGKKHPSWAKALLCYESFTARLKSCPFKTMCFSASCEVVP